MPYKFVEHPADIAIEVEGNSLEEIFISACHAWQNVVINFNSTINESSKKFILNGINPEILLIDLLNELNFQLYSKKWVFITIQNMIIEKTDSNYHLEVEMFGQTFNPGIHTMKEEIKAITYHQMKIEEVGNHLRTLIVFDI